MAHRIQILRTSLALCLRLSHSVKVPTKAFCIERLFEQNCKLIHQKLFNVLEATMFQISEKTNLIPHRVNQR